MFCFSFIYSFILFIHLLISFIRLLLHFLKLNSFIINFTFTFFFNRFFFPLHFTFRICSFARVLFYLMSFVCLYFWVHSFFFCTDFKCLFLSLQRWFRFYPVLKYEGNDCYSNKVYVVNIFQQQQQQQQQQTSIEDSVNASIQRLGDNIEKHERGLIIATRNNTGNMRINWTEITRKQKWEGKQIYGRFKRLTRDASH